MPFAGLHSFRIQRSGKFEEFRISKDTFGPGIHAVYGILVKDGERTSEVQAIRFETSKFTKAQAEAWLKEHDFSPIGYEPPASLSSVVLPCHDTDFERLELEPRPDGEHANRYRKELIREGHWKHPNSGVELDLTKTDLSRFVKMFDEMLSAELKVPVVEDHSVKAQDGHGWVIELSVERVRRKEGARWALFGVLELGDDWSRKVDQGEIRDVSISINDVKDGHDRIWKSVIDEVSVTLYPVIEGQTGFVKLAKQEGGFEYQGVTRRTLLSRMMRKEKDVRVGKKGETEGVDLAVITERLDKLQEENEGLRQQLAKKDEVIDGFKASRVQEIKAKIAEDVDERGKNGLTADGVKRVSELVDLAFDVDLDEEQASKWGTVIRETLDSIVVAGVQMGKTVDDSDQDGEEKPGSLRDKKLDEL